MKKQFILILTTVLTVFVTFNIWLSPKGNTIITSSNAREPGGVVLLNAQSISQKLFSEELLSEIEGFGESGKTLRTIQLYFGEQANCEGNIILFTFAHKEKILYQTRINMADIVPNEPCQLYINVFIDPKTEYMIHLEPETPGNSMVVQTIPMEMALTSGACETGESPYDGQLLLHYSFVQPYGKAIRIARTVFLFALFFVFIGILWNVHSCATRCAKRISVALERFQGASAIYAIILETLLCLCVLEASGLELQPAVKVALYVLSVFSAYYAHKIGHARMKELWKNKIAVGLFIVLDCYSAFAFAGNSLFVAPVSSHWNDTKMILKFFVFIMTVLWISPVLELLFLWCNDRYRGEKYRGTTGKIRSIRLYVICALIFLVPLSVMLYAYNPAISAWDTGYCLTWVSNLHGMLNWHPPFYVAVMKVLLSVWDSLYCLVFAQWLLWLYVWIELLAFLRKRGINDALLYFATAISACSVPTLLSLCTLWKDTSYATILLWVTVILARLYWNGAESPKKFFVYIELAFALVFLCLIRQNGIVPYLMTALALLILCYKNKRVVLAVVSSAFCIWAVLGPYYTYLEIEPMDPAAKYVGLTQDLMSVYYYEGDVSEDVVALVNERTSKDVLSAKAWFRADWAGGAYDFPVSLFDFARMYIETFAKNPLQMIRTCLFRNDHIWDIFGSQYNFEGNCNYTETAEMVFADVWEKYEKRVPNQLTEKLSIFIDLTFSNQLLHVLFWRVGPWTLLLLIMMAVHFIKRPIIQSWLLFVPVTGHIIGIALSAGWSEHRYFWPIILVTMFILLCTMGSADQSACKLKKRLPWGKRTENAVEL